MNLISASKEVPRKKNPQDGIMSKEKRSQWKELSVAKVGTNLATKSVVLDYNTNSKQTNKQTNKKKKTIHRCPCW